MTNPTRHRRRHPAAAAVPSRTQMPPAPTRRRGTGGCCRTWSSEHICPGGLVVRTTWHEPACTIGARP
ncbi:hypothetical protein [Streptomyces sp. CB01881]|uniref:hypothetical protein n=1 Tax=Streptomyces sp. CB01881 TaxID=2078691 RepID=UPI000CDBB528|nr:hypothetical protein [Streptomyces sp. CB01881]AUY53615.1 hypothetical protein C2142_37695 [Streptomyces sp. CB01881]TYC68631.1 hypothetical protein EH183_37710 [Streptomyces sp. CB01881]